MRTELCDGCHLPIAIELMARYHRFALCKDCLLACREWDSRNEQLALTDPERAKANAKTVAGMLHYDGPDTVSAAAVRRFRNPSPADGQRPVRGGGVG